MDGNAKTDVSNRREPGMFCGEAEQPQTFISETSYVKILFHADNFTDQVSFYTFYMSVQFILSVFVCFFKREMRESIKLVVDYILWVNFSIVLFFNGSMRSTSFETVPKKFNWLTRIITKC